MRFFGSREWSRGVMILGVILLGILATACAAGNDARAPTGTDHSTMTGMDHTAMDGTSLPADVSIDAVHASYIDIAGNTGDLRSRIAQWQAGNADSLGIAKEKLERTEILLSSTNWPPPLRRAVDKLREAGRSMHPALDGKNPESAVAIGKVMGDASHDLTHDFYGVWLPQLKGRPLPTMAAHVIYIDLAANIADLRSRVAAWEKGDESSLGIAKEKAERIQALLPLAAATGTLAKPASALQQRLPAVSAALERKDVALANAALKPLNDASHDLTHHFYDWLGRTAGSVDPACVQAAYMDLSRNAADLKERIAAWEQGDAGSLNIAQEKLERIDVILAHAHWPPLLSAAMRQTAAVLKTVAPMFGKPAPSGNSAALNPVSDSMHAVTHAFYNDYLPQAKIAARTPLPEKPPHASMPLSALGSSAESSGSHGHASEVASVDAVSKGWILGGFGAVNLLVIGTAALLKSRKPVRQRPPRGRQQTPTSGGSSE